jgi:DNA-binding phage protein
MRQCVKVSIQVSGYLRLLLRQDITVEKRFELSQSTKMNRYEQRRQKLLQNKEIAAGYQEMAAELELMHAIDDVRKQLHLSQEQLATRMGKKREAVSRLLSADNINPTLDTLIELLSALNLTADSTLRQARGPIKVAMEIAPSQ